ncbi:uncharacterized protein LOC144453107 [Glandiceps talaboti]
MSVTIRNLFNFFSKIGNEGHQAFYDSWKMTADVVIKNPHFMRTQLHKNLIETETYKYYNFAQFDSDQLPMFRPELATAEWGAEMSKYKQSGRVGHPGGYLEIATFDGEPISPAAPKGDSSVFLTTGYKVTDGVNTDELETTWKELSGANLMHSTPSVGFHNAGLYKRFTEGSPNPFSYIVRAELTKPGEDLKEGLELLEKVRSLKLQDGITAESSLYRVLPESIFDKEK